MGGIAVAAERRKRHRVSLRIGQSVRVRMRRWAAGLVIGMAACAGSDNPSSTAPSTTSASAATTASAADIGAVAPAAELVQQCADAAAELQFAVPCPALLPTIDGRATSCSERPPGTAPLPPCVAQAGGDETLDTIFFLNVEDYDGSSEDRHLVIEARRVERAPPTPCYGGEPQPDVITRHRSLAMLRCGGPTPQSEASNRHGQGAHYEHLLGYWDEGGVRYVVSVHRGGDAERQLLEAVADSIQLVSP
jgi:hypothetical protein